MVQKQATREHPNLPVGNLLSLANEYKGSFVKVQSSIPWNRPGTETLKQNKPDNMASLIRLLVPVFEFGPI